LLVVASVVVGGQEGHVAVGCQVEVSGQCVIMETQFDAVETVGVLKVVPSGGGGPEGGRAPSQAPAAGSLNCEVAVGRVGAHGVVGGEDEVPDTDAAGSVIVHSGTLTAIARGRYGVEVNGQTTFDENAPTIGKRSDTNASRALIGGRAVSSAELRPANVAVNDKSNVTNGAGSVHDGQAIRNSREKNTCVIKKIVVGDAGVALVAGLVCAVRNG